jgi:uncharacterized membrane protein
VLLLLLCTVVGAAVQTPTGQALRERLEVRFLERIPGYTLIRSLTHRLAKKGEGTVWQPALSEIEEALVPSFIIEEFVDGRYTVFVPSIPTPLAGAVYILDRDRVHPVDVPFAQAIKTVARWGSGARDLVAAMEREVVAMERS